MTRRPKGEGCIYKRSDGKWVASLDRGMRPDGSRDRPRRVRDTQAAAAAALREMIRQREAGVRTSRTPTVREWLDEWLARAEPGLKPSSATFYRNVTGLYLAPALGAARLDRLEPADVTGLYARMRARGLSAGTVRAAHRTLRAALRAAVDEGLIARSPLSRVREPRAEEAEVDPLTREEIAAILRAAEFRRNGARWAVALALGLRQGEALGLRIDDVDLEALTLCVRRAAQRRVWQHGCRDPRGCGPARQCQDRWRAGATTEPKSRAGARLVALPEPLAALLREHLRAQAAERLAAGSLWRNEGWLFTTHTGGMIHSRNDARAWRALLEAAGVRQVRLHDARHTAATTLLLEGVDPRTVMDVLGWSQLEMTRRYQHVVGDLRREAARRVGAALWPTGETANIKTS